MYVYQHLYIHVAPLTNRINCTMV